MKLNSQKKILVVDDEPMVCESFRMILDFDGHEMEEANTGREALDKLGRGKFDVVFTDLCMPEMRGDQLAREIKVLNQDTPVVMVTGFPPDPKPDAVSQIIIKPFDLASIREALAGV